MHFVSTQSRSHRYTFSEALNLSLAPDGGLIVPEAFPTFVWKDFLAEKKNSLPALAEAWLRPFLQGDPLESSLSEICREAFNFSIPLRKLDDRAQLLELFHGPTCAFKDVGARFLAECLERMPSKPSPERTILVATSGDTGGAVAAAFYRRPHIKVVILFPRAKVSLRQEKQLTTWGGNVSAFAVRGDFDDCQRMVKEAFALPQWRAQYGLCSANSINLGRLLPQAVYYAASSLSYFRDRPAHTSELPGFIVPSGNLGNANAALWAKRTGLPIGRVVVAHNANRAVANFFDTGRWNPLKTIATIANAMDVGNPSNFERLKNLYPDLEVMKKDVLAFSFDDQTIRNSIRDAYSRWGEAICPHTATGVAAFDRLPRGHWILAATAHPAKFEKIVEPIIGKALPIPAALSQILSRPSQVTEIDSTLKSLEHALKNKENT